ncbi:MAG: hypothetical protein JWN43_3703 [Gammaproteobacteria bacterium]|nr:hypothetical protein [Gammaproteobacteria bacterium]
MDLSDLASCSGIAIRRLRYVISHGLVPKISRVEEGRGWVRSFSEFEAFSIALAALLLDAGVKRQLAQECLRQLSRTSAPIGPVEQVPLHVAFSSRGPASILIGDGRCLRLRTSLLKRTGVFDTGWAGNGDGSIPEDYEPIVLLQVNLAPLREAVKRVAAKAAGS